MLKRSKTVAVQLILLAGFLLPTDAVADSNDPSFVTGRTNRPGDNGFGCAACHAPGAAGGTLTVTISGASTLAAGGSSTYTVTANSNLAAGLRMGVVIATSAPDAIPAPLAGAAPLFYQSTSRELIHDVDLAALAVTNASGDASYNFTFRMPAGALPGSTYTLYAVSRVGPQTTGVWAHATPFTITVPATIPGAPGSPSGVAGNGQVTVSFSPAAANGSTITSYRATSSPGGFTNTNTTSPIIVSGLTNGTGYTFSVTATNGIGTGPSASTGSITPFTVPGAPNIGTATPGNGSLSVAFTAGANGGSAITSYAATCGGFTNTGANSPIVVSGLTNGMAYTCTVVATNAAGPGAPSAPSSSATPFTVPTAPGIGSATPGDAQATVTFTASSFNGGSAITSYTLRCVGPNTRTNTGSASPLTATGMTNGANYVCAVFATNAAGNSADSATVNVTPSALPPLALVSVVSRKTHGAAGIFDAIVDSSIAISGLVTTESRVIGSGHTLVFTFNNPITAAGSVSATDAAMVAVGSASSVGSGNDVVVTLNSIPDNKRLTVTLTNVNGLINSFPASLGFLVGDVNNTRSVTASDISGVKARSGQTTTALNFKFDVNVSGAINAADISAVKARSGLTLPQ